MHRSLDLHRLSKIIVSLIFVLSHQRYAFAADESLTMNGFRVPQQASEYIFHSSPREYLISVQLLGAVQKPGVYYIPANTDLLKLLTLAGTNSESDLSNLLVRKSDQRNWSDYRSKNLQESEGAYKLNAEDMMLTGGLAHLKLSQDDFVYVPRHESWISPETYRSITLVSMVMSIILTSVLIDKNSK